MIPEVVLSIFVTFMVVFAMSIRRKIQSPSPVAFQCIPSDLCPVIYEQVIGDVEKIEQAATPAERRLRREALWTDFRLNWFYLCEEASNTKLFLRALLFEKLRIPPLKSGMKYDDREVLVLQLIREATELRWKQVRCQLLLLARFFLGRKLRSEILAAMLDQYKELEEQIDHLSGMMDEDLQRKLRDALGLNWGLMSGNGNPGPGVA